MTKDLDPFAKALITKWLGSRNPNPQDDRLVAKTVCKHVRAQKILDDLEGQFEEFDA